MQLIKQWALALVAFLLHTVLLGLFATLVLTSSDSETAMIWILFYYLDWPIATIYPESVDAGFPLVTFFFGGLQWAAIGAGIQYLARSIIRRLK